MFTTREEQQKIANLANKLGGYRELIRYQQMRVEKINFTRVTFTLAEVRGILEREAGLDKCDIRLEDSNGLPCPVTKVTLSSRG